MITMCKKCHQEEEHSVRPNGRPISHCKKCQREYSKLHYKEHKIEHNKRRYINRKENQGRIKDHLQNLKSSTPCVDCGRFFPYYVMDFDHVEGDKSFNLGEAPSYCYQTVLKEIKKCEIVCANCHRERTFQRITG